MHYTFTRTVVQYSLTLNSFATTALVTELTRHPDLLVGLTREEYRSRVHHTIPTDSVPTDAIPTVHSRDVGWLTAVA